MKNLSENEFSVDNLIENEPEVIKVPDSEGNKGCVHCVFFKDRCPDYHCIDEKYHWELKK